MTDPEDGKVDLSTVYEALKEQYGEAMDENAELVLACRRRAEKAFALSIRCDQLGDKYREIGALWLDASQAHAFSLAESISSEYDLNDVFTVTSEDLDLEEDEDDE